MDRIFRLIGWLVGELIALIILIVMGVFILVAVAFTFVVAFSPMILMFSAAVAAIHYLFKFW